MTRSIYLKTANEMLTFYLSASSKGHIMRVDGDGRQCAQSDWENGRSFVMLYLIVSGILFMKPAEECRIIIESVDDDVRL